jgi:hypothetical protein
LLCCRAEDKKKLTDGASLSGDLGFISGYLADTLDNPNMISVDASEQRMHLAAGVSVLQAAVDAQNLRKPRIRWGKCFAIKWRGLIAPR